jgi:phospholipase/carboxylesterase
MAMTTRLDGPRVAPAAGGAARQLVILLHGIGADGADLIDLAPYLARTLPNAAFVAPNAPQPCDMAPFGYQWFSLQDRHPDRLAAGVRAAAPVLDAFIDVELAAHGLADDRLALLGFSQGCMMALHVGPRRAAACAAILGYSGRLVAAETLAGEIASRPPVLLCHGTADPVVPFESLALAAAVLEAAGIAVTVLERPGLGHGIDPPAIEAGAALLARTLAA